MRHFRRLGHSATRGPRSFLTHASCSGRTTHPCVAALGPELGDAIFSARPRHSQPVHRIGGKLPHQTVSASGCSTVQLPRQLGPACRGSWRSLVPIRTDMLSSSHSWFPQGFTMSTETPKGFMLSSRIATLEAVVCCKEGGPFRRTRKPSRCGALGVRQFHHGRAVPLRQGPVHGPPRGVGLKDDSTSGLSPTRRRRT